MTRNISDPNYSLMSAKDFFGGTDPVRIVIIIYIFISLILNFLIFVVVGKQYRINKGVSLGILVTCAILFVNFAHTFAYFFEWVIKNEIDKIEIKKDNIVLGEVGGLLTGNPSNFAACTIQAFILISSSISQDFIINIFFYMITNGEDKLQKRFIKIYLLILGLVFPICFTLIYYFVGALGLNDEFCYVTKFKFSIENNVVNYVLFEPFQLCVTIVYVIRVVNFFITFYFLIDIIRYVKREHKDKVYIFKSITIPIIQLFTIFIGVIYRLLNLSSSKESAKISWLYLVLNTLDGVLFPLIFMFNNNILTNLNKIFSKNENSANEDGQLLEFNECDDDDEE